MFSLEFSDDALLQLKKMDNSSVKRITSALSKSCGNPFHFFERLVGRDESKLRVGDYRILVRTIPEEKKIFVIGIGHRKNIYKRA